jgi:predicted permease
VSRIRSLIRNLLLRERVERELDDELRSYHQMLVEEKKASGLSEEEAARQAHLEMGRALQVKESVREVRMGWKLEGIWRDLRLVIRQFRRRPRLALAIVVTLGLAIGMNVAVFSVVNAVVLRALPYAAPERLVWISSVRPDNPAAPFSLPEFLDYTAQARTVSVAAYANWSASLEMQGATQRLQAARMSGNSFEVLGVSPAAGRLLQRSDDAAEAPPVALLSYSLWQRQFGGDASVVGRPLRINGESVVVVGILPRHFPLPLQGIDVVLPLSPDRDPSRFLRSSTNFLLLFGRLRDGVTREQAQAELTSICRTLRQQFPKEYARKDSVRAIPLHEALVADYRQSMLSLLGAVVVVLGTALANLVSLVLIRANDRRTEVALRIALGASRWHLIRQLVVEGALLAISGSSAGWMLASAFIAVMLPWLPASIPRLGEVSVDQRVWLFALALTAVTTVVLSLAPLGALARSRTEDGLRLRARGAAGDRWNHFGRQALVVGEIATTMVLLLTTAILVENVWRLQRVQPGFDPSGVFQARVSIPPAYRSADSVVQFYERLSQRIVALPGVQQVGMISIAPLSGLLATAPFGVEGAPAIHDRDIPSANLRIITPGYLEAVGTRLRDGRPLSETDRSDSPPVALVSAALVNRFLAPNPIGRRLLIDDNSDGPRPVEVVGVVEDVRQTALDTPPAFDVYIPLRQIHPEGVPRIRNNQFWMIKVATDPGAFRTPFLTELRAVDPEAAISTTGPMGEFVEAWFGPRRFSLALFAAFAGTALLLAVSGVYAVVSYGVSQRRHEIALRMAVGATEADVHRLILGQAARLVGAGLGVGALVAAGAGPLVSWMAHGATLDPWLSFLAAGLLAAVVTAAAWLPARRAARIDPREALQGE